MIRCRISDADGEVQLVIDDQVFTMKDVESMLRSYAGWGLRMVIVPEDEIERAPTIVVGESRFVDGPAVGEA